MQLATVIDDDLIIKVKVTIAACEETERVGSSCSGIGKHNNNKLHLISMTHKNRHYN